MLRNLVALVVLLLCGEVYAQIRPLPPLRSIVVNGTPISVPWPVLEFDGSVAYSNDAINKRMVLTFSGGGGGGPGSITLNTTSPLTGGGTGSSFTLACAACVTTSGSYANPSWITSFAASKLSGAVAIANGGTGSTTRIFVQTTGDETVAGTKTFTSVPKANGMTVTGANGFIFTDNVTDSGLYETTEPHVKFRFNQPFGIAGTSLCMAATPIGGNTEGCLIAFDHTSASSILELNAADFAGTPSIKYANSIQSFYVGGSPQLQFNNARKIIPDWNGNDTAGASPAWWMGHHSGIKLGTHAIVGEVDDRLWGGVASFFFDTEVTELTCTGAVTYNPVLQGSGARCTSSGNVTSFTIALPDDGSGRLIDGFNVAIKLKQGNASHTWPSTIGNAVLPAGLSSMKPSRALHGTDWLLCTYFAADSLYQCHVGSDTQLWAGYSDPRMCPTPTGGNTGLCCVSNGSVWVASSCGGGGGGGSTLDAGDGFATLAYTGAAPATLQLQLNASGGLSKTLGAGHDLGIAALGVTNAMLAGSIANAKLANSSVTVSTTSPLGGGGAVSLGGALTLTCSTCLTASPTTTGDMFYSTSGGQALSRLAAVALGYVLASGGVATGPQWLAPGGDVTGAIGALTVGKIQGKAVGSTTPTDGMLLIGRTSDSSWVPATLTAGSNVTITNAGGSITIASSGGASGYATVQNAGSGLTQRATLNCATGLTCADNAGQSRTDVSLTSTSTTVNGTTCSLGGNCTPTAATPNAHTAGTGLSGSTFDGSAARTWTVDVAFSPSWTGTHTFMNASSLRINNSADTFYSRLVSAATAARTATLPDATGTLAMLSLAQSWSAVQTHNNAGRLRINNSADTFYSELTSAATANRTWTIPDATDTAAGLAATQTFTNKTISGSSNTLSNIGNGSLTNSSVTVTAGTGMSGGGAVALGASVTLTNAGVTSITGTTNQITASASTGAVTLSTPQDIATSSLVRFGALGLNVAAPSVAGEVSMTQAVATSGSPNALLLTGGAHTTLAASTEASDVNLNLNRTVQFAAGALTTQRAVLVQAPTYGFVSASTLTNTATLAIDKAPVAGTNATLTNKYALWVQADKARFDGGVSTASGQTYVSGSNTLIGAISDKLNATQLAIGSQAIGDLLYADSTTTFTRLADVAAGSFLRSGGASTAPAWSTTTWPNSASSGDLVVATGANAYGNLGVGLGGRLLAANDAGTAPVYGHAITKQVQISTGTAAGNVDTTVLAIPSGATSNTNSFLVTGVVVRVVQAMVGSGSMAVTAGASAGGTEYLGSQTVTSATGVGTVYGLTTAQAGSSFASSNQNNALTNGSTNVVVRVAVSGTVSTQAVLLVTVMGIEL